MRIGRIELNPISDVQFEAVEYDAEDKPRWRHQESMESWRDALGKIQSSQSPELARLMALVGVSGTTADQISRGGLRLEIHGELLDEASERWLRRRPFGPGILVRIRGASSEAPDDEGGLLSGDADERFEPDDAHGDPHPARGASNE